MFLESKSKQEQNKIVWQYSKVLRKRPKSSWGFWKTGWKKNWKKSRLHRSYTSIRENDSKSIQWLVFEKFWVQSRIFKISQQIAIILFWQFSTNGTNFWKIKPVKMFLEFKSKQEQKKSFDNIQRCSEKCQKSSWGGFLKNWVQKN